MTKKYLPLSALRPTIYERDQSSAADLRDHLSVPAGGFDQQASSCVQ